MCVCRQANSEEGRGCVQGGGDREMRSRGGSDGLGSAARLRPAMAARARGRGRGPSAGRGEIIVNTTCLLLLMRRAFWGSAPAGGLAYVHTLPARPVGWARSRKLARQWRRANASSIALPGQLGAPPISIPPRNVRGSGVEGGAAGRGSGVASRLSKAPGPGPALPIWQPARARPCGRAACEPAWAAAVHGAARGMLPPFSHAAEQAAALRPPSLPASVSACVPAALPTCLPPARPAGTGKYENCPRQGPGRVGKNQLAPVHWASDGDRAAAGTNHGSVGAATPRKRPTACSYRRAGLQSAHVP